MHRLEHRHRPRGRAPLLASAECHGTRKDMDWRMGGQCGHGGRSTGKSSCHSDYSRFRPPKASICSTDDPDRPHLQVLPSSSLSVCTSLLGIDGRSTYLDLLGILHQLDRCISGHWHWKLSSAKLELFNGSMICS